MWGSYYMGSSGVKVFIYFTDGQYVIKLRDNKDKVWVRVYDKRGYLIFKFFESSVEIAKRSGLLKAKELGYNINL